jgi:hypothetical protein
MTRQVHITPSGAGFLWQLIINTRTAAFGWCATYSAAESAGRLA